MSKLLLKKLSSALPYRPIVTETAAVVTNTNPKQRASRGETHL